MCEDAADDEACDKGDCHTLERLVMDLPLNGVRRSTPHAVQRVLQFDQIALDGFHCDVALRAAVRSVHDITHTAIDCEVNR